MADQNSKKKNKRLSKGQRTHIRRLKQIASKEAGIDHATSSPGQPKRGHKKADQS